MVDLMVFLMDLRKVKMKGMYLDWMMVVVTAPMTVEMTACLLIRVRVKWKVYMKVKG
jgi:hypothetical protein